MTEHTLAPVDHSSRAHARLSASGSDRWLNCTMAPTAEEGFPDTSSEHSERGTWGHEAVEIQLEHWLGEITMSEYVQKMGEHQKSKYHDAATWELVKFCVDFAIELITDLRKQHGDVNVVVLQEQRLDFSKWVPDGFGTGDLVVIVPGKIIVLDWKMGQMRVSAHDNSQLKLYGLAAFNTYDFLYEFNEVEMYIVQPRLGATDSYTMSADALVEWADTVVKPQALKAHTGEGAVYSPSTDEDGGHCRWCKARSVCKARAQALSVPDEQVRNPDLMDESELKELYPRLPGLITWAKDVIDYVDAQVIAGSKQYGLKVVAGRSNRVISDVSLARTVLVAEGFPEEIITAPLPDERPLLGLGELEKVVGRKRFSEISEPFVSRTTAKPTVIPESDPREPIDLSKPSAEDDFAGCE